MMNDDKLLLLLWVILYLVNGIVSAIRFLIDRFGYQSVSAFFSYEAFQVLLFYYQQSAIRFIASFALTGIQMDILYAAVPLNILFQFRKPTLDEMQQLNRLETRLKVKIVNRLKTKGFEYTYQISVQSARKKILCSLPAMEHYIFRGRVDDFKHEIKIAKDRDEILFVVFKFLPEKQILDLRSSM